MSDFGHVDMLTAGAFIGALVLFGSIALLGSRDPARIRFRERLDRVGGKRMSSPEQAVLASLRRRDFDDDKNRFRRLITSMVPRRKAMVARLERTGRKIPLWSYVVTCGIVTVISSAVIWLALGLPAAVAPLLGLVAGIGLPHFVVGRMARRRIAKFVALFPDALDLLVRTVKSGLPIAEGIDVASHDFDEPVRSEFRRVSDSMRVGRTLEEALWDTAERLQIPEFNFFVVSLSVQRETGGNIAETLQNLSTLLRRRQQMKLKVRAMSSEARASAWILGMLPFGMFGILYFVNEPYIMSLFEDVRGHVLIGAGLVSQFIGVLVMAKMSRFEI